MAITISLPWLISFLLLISLGVLGYIIWTRDKKFKSQLKEIEELSVVYKTALEEKFKGQLEAQKKYIDLYESYILNFNNVIVMCDDRLKELDIRGVFKSDDEIGFFFNSVLQLQAEMNKFKVELIRTKEL